MTEKEEIQKMKLVKMKMTALSNFHEKGIDWVKSNYPEMVSFVEKNKDRSQVEVSRELHAEFINQH